MTVSELQTCLNQLGATPPLVVDGVLGPKTQASMDLLQSKLWDNAGMPNPFLEAIIRNLIALGVKPLQS